MAQNPLVCGAASAATCPPGWPTSQTRDFEIAGETCQSLTVGSPADVIDRRPVAFPAGNDFRWGDLLKCRGVERADGNGLAIARNPQAGQQSTSAI